MLIQLNEYITQIAWSPLGETLAAASAAGEVVLLDGSSGKLLFQLFDDRQNQSIDALEFAANGQFLAAAGQSGKLSVWAMQPSPTLLFSQDFGGWIEHLAWHPVLPLLAFSVGKQVQIWDIRSLALTTQLNFNQSSVFDLAWHPEGDLLAVSGYQGTQVWQLNDRDPAPHLLTVNSASISVAWSPNGQYIAAGNLDKTLTLWEWENVNPWIMRGFPGKVQHLAWHSTPSNPSPLLASVSIEGIVIWDKLAGEETDWNGTILGTHDGPIAAIAWHPALPYLASAGEDGQVKVWSVNKSENNLPISIHQGTAQGFTTLGWQPRGDRLAAGGECGELFIWNTGIKSL